MAQSYKYSIYRNTGYQELAFLMGYSQMAIQTFQLFLPF